MFCAIQIELFPFRYPITCATEYFGGIEISMCTWSGIRCLPRSGIPCARRAHGIYSPIVARSVQQQFLAVLRREHDIVLALPCRGSGDCDPVTLRSPCGALRFPKEIV